ncbi:MAG: sugar ABC transporter substrate-binding protein [Solirubrobacterales bacterium]|nr:sugar ABC transporter substrate-binding protein [Solirubrobacterales bacterium]
MRPRYVLVVLAALAALAGCGDTKTVREDPILVSGSESGAGAEQGAGTGDGVRIAVVTHGQASSPFWAIVRNGVTAASRQLDVQVDYKAPDVYSLDRMKELIEQAVASKPDGLVVSYPEPGLAPTIRAAVRAGIPVVTINSGSDEALKLGVLAHVGQPELRAGERAGARLAEAGVRRAMCVNQQPGNQGLDDRCRGLARAMRKARGSSFVLGVDDQDPQTARVIADELERRRADGILTLNSTTGATAVEARRLAGRNEDSVPIGTFDMNPVVLEGVRLGRILFAVDQQPYLQGYQPIVMLAQRARYGLFPSQGDVVATGPNFVTRADAGKAIELSRRSIR